MLKILFAKLYNIVRIVLPVLILLCSLSDLNGVFEGISRYRPLIRPQIDRWYRPHCFFNLFLASLNQFKLYPDTDLIVGVRSIAPPRTPAVFTKYLFTFLA